jgi:hypothetical protein
VATPRYPAAARRAELPGDLLRVVHDLHAGLKSFRTILADSENPVPGTTAAERAKAAAAADRIRERLIQTRDALAWSQSSYWRADRARAAELTSSVAQMLNDLRRQVRVAPNTVRLTRTRGLVPITVLNSLGTPVRVRITLRPQRFGLTFGPVPDVTVPAARGALPGSALIQVPAEARTVGKFPVDAQLLTADNVQIGPPSPLTVSTTAYGRLALTVTVGSFLLLVLASLIRFVFRRRRDGRARPPDDGSDRPEDGAGPAPAAETVDLPPTLTSAAT